MSCTAVLSLGSNLGDPAARLLEVVTAARDADVLVAASSVYATAPWGGVAQPEFLNAVLLVTGPGAGGEGPASPRGWLEWGQELERAARRTRGRRWGPRTLDVDIVSCTVDGDEVMDDDPELTLPHPRAARRAFVLVPWLEVDPVARLAGRPVAELLDSLGPAERAGVRRTGIASLIGQD